MNEKKASRRGLLDSSPIFILSTDTEKENNTVDGYQKDENEILTKMPAPVTEFTPITNDVYKMSLSWYGTRDEYGNYSEEGGSSGGGSYSGTLINDTNPMPGGTTTTSSNYTQGLKITWMKCLEKKESCFESNDVHFIGAKDNVDPFLDLIDVPQYFPTATQGWNWNGTVSNGTAQTNTEGNLVRHYTTAEVDNQTDMLVNWTIDTGAYQGNGTIFYCIIFEHDNYPAPKKDVTFNFPNGDIKIIKYRGWENEYAKPMLYNDTCLYNCTNPTTFPTTSSFWQNSNNWLIYRITRN